MKISVRPRTVCKDGFSISIQASSLHNCSPRTDEGPWDQLELGFPEGGSTFGLLEPYRDWITGDVFHYVPTEVVEELLRRHGGVV